MTWARRMDKGPNPGENKDRGRDWTDFPGASPGSWLEML
jgi:hypothetical protein